MDENHSKRISGLTFSYNELCTQFAPYHVIHLYMLYLYVLCLNFYSYIYIYMHRPISILPIYIRVTSLVLRQSYERQGVPNHQQLVCFFQQLDQVNNSGTSKLCNTDHFVRGIHRWPVDSPHEVISNAWNVSMSIRHHSKHAVLSSSSPPSLYIILSPYLHVNAPQWCSI